MSPVATLGSVCTHIVDCEHKTAPIDPLGDYYAVGTPAMRGNRIDFGEARKISQETFLRWTRRLPPRPGDLLFAREAPVGPIVRIPQEGNIAPGQRTVLLRPDPLRVASEYLYYLLSSPAQQGLIAMKSAGSTVAHLNVADVRGFLLPPLPTLPQQRAIAEVLGALDDKIAANRILAVVADEFVRAGFAGMTSRACSLVTIAQLADHPRDLVSPAVLEPDMPYVGLEHVPRRRMWLDSVGRSCEVTSAKAAYCAGDVLFGKLRPYFHKVVAAPTSGVCSTDILVVRPKEKALFGFLLAAASSDETVERCTAASEGTRMPRTSWKDLGAVSVPWPGHDEAIEFGARVDGLRMRIEAAVVENDVLGRVRDALLPELMSGRIRVKDAECVVEEVV